MVDRPRVRNAPGLVWKKRAQGAEARWQARTDLIARGWVPKSARLWCGGEPTETEWAWIVDRCQALQTEMLVWGRGGIPQLAPLYDGTMRSLIRCYQTDRDSAYRKLRYRTRLNYDSLTKRLETDCGDEPLREMKARSFLRWYEQWTAGHKFAMGHSMVAMMRTLFAFGATILEDGECERLASIMHRMRFKIIRPRQERMTAEQATALRTKAHEKGLHSIALAQAFQFECLLRQKDVIGEWVPLSEPGLSDLHVGGMKWQKGITWAEIDANLILRHVTSKRGKAVEVDLKLAPMVMEELERLGERPTKGPVIIAEPKDIPWTHYEFRRQWRRMANEAGIPASVFNMDSRAGGITEATDAGADLEHVRHAATHENISITQRYSRGATEKTAQVMQIRAAHRKNRSGTT